LTTGDKYYSAINSHLNGPLPVGTILYAQVDSANANTNDGAVLETHEITGEPYNNISGPMLSTLAVTAVAVPALTSDRWLNDMIDLIRNGLPAR